MKRLLIYLYLPLVAIYLFVSVAHPTDQTTMARRHLDVMQARVVSLSIALPLITIWLVAWYGSHRLIAYAASIKRYPDGKPMQQLAYGVALMAVYMPVRGTVKIVLNYVATQHPNLMSLTNALIIYVSLVVPLIAFVMISQAAHTMSVAAKARSSLRAVYLFAVVFTALGIAYCYATFSNQGNIPSTNWLLTSEYSIPVMMRVVTVDLPYLFMWFIGLMAIYDLYLYQKLVKGSLYRQSLRMLSFGLAMVIVVSIAIQFATAVGEHLQKLQLTGILAIAYTLLLLLGVGFGVIAKGVGRMQRLEKA